ncbi:MAG: endolytic transglycosylase MltG [Candidatus Pacebacteria bacterium]|nr:endolytic transglycosylase MltG [Candidatus Paceibacterota bacterium]
MEQIPSKIQKIKTKILEFYFSKIKPRFSKTVLIVVIGVVVFLWLLSLIFFAPPSDFPKEKLITIPKGESLKEISTLLQNEHIIKSEIAFDFCMVSLGVGKGVMAGEYLFQKPASVCTIAWRTIHGISGIPSAKVTIPEGTSNKGISVILAESLPGFDASLFLKDLAPHEGYLFPDTYLFSSRASVQDVEKIFTDNFQTKIEPLLGEIKESGHSLRDIIIMASILEKEAKTPEDQAIVSGILWKRIDNLMPLQVDAPFYYLLGKESNELTLADLKIKSAYNTYINRGLPEGPIGNPGLGAIRSAIFPQKTAFLYYLSDKNGVMHYAKTFEEHKENKAKYLR